MGMSIDWNTNPIFYTNPLIQKAFKLTEFIFCKIFCCWGQLGL